MADTVDTDITIAAPPEVVWRILTDFAGYARWNPFIVEAAGEAREGARFTALFRPAGARGVRLRPRVLRAEPYRELRWRGSVLVPGLYDGEHAFTLTALPGGGTRVRQQERFTGLLAPLMRSKLDATRRSFAALDAALRDRAEAVARA